MEQKYIITEIKNYENVSERIHLSLHYLENNADPALFFMPYFEGYLYGIPRYEHSEWDACDAGWRMIEAFILARQVIGQKEPTEQEKRLRKFVLSTIREDGLSYRPELEWCKPEAFMWDHGRALIALATWLIFEPSDEIKRIAVNMIEGLVKIALKDDNMLYYPAENWDGQCWGKRVIAHPPTGLAIEGMVDIAGIIGVDRFLDYAGAFVNAVRKRAPYLFDDDGNMVRMGGGPYNFVLTHVHSRLAILNGMLKYAIAVQDQSLMDWCIRAFSNVKSNLCSTFGWVPEGIETGPDWKENGRDEVCAISDMMQIAAVLAKKTIPAERDLIVRYGLNQIFSHQILDCSKYASLMEKGNSFKNTMKISYTNMPERCIGGFNGSAHPNDIVHFTGDFRAVSACGQESTAGLKAASASGCCSPAGIKALYVLWKEAVKRYESELFVYGRMTMENEDVVMQCGEPFKGEMSIKVKRNIEHLLIHFPDMEYITDFFADRPYTLKGEWVDFGSFKENDSVILSYTLKPISKKEIVGSVEYEFDWLGSRVLDVRPSGKIGDPYWWRKPKKS